MKEINEKEDTFDKRKCYCNKVKYDICDYCWKFMMSPTPKFLEYVDENNQRGNVQAHCSEEEWKLFKNTILNDNKKWQHFKEIINTEEEFYKWKNQNLQDH